MSGNLGGFTDFTGIRVGGGNAIPSQISSDCSPGSGQAWQSYKTFSMVALTLTANGSTTTVVNYPGAAIGDIARAHVFSSLSSGAGNGGAFVNAANQVTVVISNASTAALSIPAQTLGVIVERWSVL
jgi:hypothetical protein